MEKNTKKWECACLFPRKIRYSTIQKKDESFPSKNTFYIRFFQFWLSKSILVLLQSDSRVTTKHF